MSAIRDNGGAVASAIALQRYQALLAPEPPATAVVEPDKPQHVVRDGVTVIGRR